MQGTKDRRRHHARKGMPNAEEYIFNNRAPYRRPHRARGMLCVLVRHAARKTESRSGKADPVPFLQGYGSD